MRFLQVTSLFALGGAAGTVWGTDQLYPRDGNVKRNGWEDVLKRPNIIVIMTDDQDLQSELCSSTACSSARTCREGSHA